jgi:hypothetical protein
MGICAGKQVTQQVAPVVTVTKDSDIPNDHIIRKKVPKLFNLTRNKLFRKRQVNKLSMILCAQSLSPSPVSNNNTINASF